MSEMDLLGKGRGEAVMGDDVVKADRRERRHGAILVTGGCVHLAKPAYMMISPSGNFMPFNPVAAALV